MRQTEWAIQKQIHIYLSKALPEGSFAWAVDHAQKTSAAARMGMAARGVSAGIPDHHIIYRGTLITLEIKVPGNYPTDNQIAFGHRLAQSGAYWFVVHNCEEVEHALHSLGVELNATVRVPVPLVPNKQKRVRKSPAKPRGLVSNPIPF